MPCGVGPSPASEVAFLDPSEGLDPAGDAPTSHILSAVSALSVAPVDFHAQHFMKPSEQPDGRAKDAWMWFWPVESKESRTPLKDDEPILSLRPKALAIACRLCWGQKKWKAYKNCDGIVTTLRTHLRNQHETIYKGYLQTGAWETEACKHKGGDIDEPFHLAGFLERLLRWMVIDDQVRSIFISSSIHCLMP